MFAVCSAPLGRVWFKSVAYLGLCGLRKSRSGRGSCYGWLLVAEAAWSIIGSRIATWSCSGRKRLAHWKTLRCCSSMRSLGTTFFPIAPVILRGVRSSFPSKAQVLKERGVHRVINTIKAARTGQKCTCTMSSCLYSLPKVLILTGKSIEKKVQWEISGLPLLPRRTVWFYHLHDNCLLVRSCHPNSSLPSPSQIMQEMLDKVFFCSSSINSSFALFF